MNLDNWPSKTLVVFVKFWKQFSFVPAEQVNYLKESFGLIAFVSPTVKREEYKEIVEKIGKEKAPIVFTPEKRRNYSFLKYRAIVLLSVGVSGAIGYKVYQNYEQEIAQQTLFW